MWINPLDKVPQIPVDWANHICQGGLYSLPLTAAATYWLPLDQASLVGLGIMGAVSAVKKVADYFKEHESLQMCVGKALVTVIWPASLALCLNV